MPPATAAAASRVARCDTLFSSHAATSPAAPRRCIGPALHAQLRFGGVRYSGSGVGTSYLSAAAPLLSASAAALRLPRHGHTRSHHRTTMAASSATPSVAVTEVASAPAQRPGLPRSGACAVALPPGTLHAGRPALALLLGGYTEEPATKARAASSDARVFVVDAPGADPASGRWQALELAAGSPLPRARLVAQAAVAGGAAWLVAGWDPGQPGTGGDILSDVWRLDLTSWTWQEVSLEGEALPPISRFQMVALDDNRLLIHTHRSSEDVFVLETAAPPKARLSRLPVAGPAPSSRGLHTLTLAGGKLWLFGGAPQSGPMLSDLWSLDLTASQPAWRQHTPPAGAPAPHARCSHVAGALWAGRWYLLLQGGSFYKTDGTPGLQPLDDVWAFDTQAGAWLQPRLSGSPPSARNAAACVALGPDTLLTTGGWWPFRESYADSHLLRLTSG